MKTTKRLSLTLAGLVLANGYAVASTQVEPAPLKINPYSVESDISDEEYKKLKERLKKHETVIDIKKSVMDKQNELLKSQKEYLSTLEEVNSVKDKEGDKSKSADETKTDVDSLKKEVVDAVLAQIGGGKGSAAYSAQGVYKPKTIYDDLDGLYLISTFMDVNKNRSAKVLYRGATTVVSKGDGVVGSWSVINIDRNNIELKHTSGATKLILAKSPSLIAEELKQEQELEFSRKRNELEVQKMQMQNEILPIVK